MFSKSHKKSSKKKEQKRVHPAPEQIEERVDPASTPLLVNVMRSRDVFQGVSGYLTLEELSRFRMVSTRARELGEKNMFEDPQRLLAALALATPKQIAVLMLTHTKHAAHMQSLAEDPNNHMAYACWALMTNDINTLNSDRLRYALNDLKEKRYSPHIINSLEFIQDFLVRGKTGLLQLLKPIVLNDEFFYMNLSGTEMSLTDLSMKNLRGINLCNANLRGAEMTRAHLCCANLGGAEMTGAVCNGANLSEANMVGTRLDGASLANADFVNTDLRLASCVQANFMQADMRGAKLRRANFSKADLSFVNLMNADMRGINLIGAKLYAVKIDNTSLKGAIFFSSKMEINELTGLLEQYKHYPKKLRRAMRSSFLMAMNASIHARDPEETKALFYTALGSELFFDEKSQQMINAAMKEWQQPESVHTRTLTGAAQAIEEEMDKRPGHNGKRGK